MMIRNAYFVLFYRFPVKYPIMSEFAKLKRPKRGETEEDLLKEMKQFEASKASVTPENIVNFSKSNKDESAKKTSKFASERQKQKRQHDDDDGEASKSSIAFILKSVVQEKDFLNSDSFDFGQKMEPEQPFPVAEKLLLSYSHKTVDASKSTKKKSLFAQQMLSGKDFMLKYFLALTSNVQRCVYNVNGCLACNHLYLRS